MTARGSVWQVAVIAAVATGLMLWISVPASAATRTYTKGPMNKAIPDDGLLLSPLSIPDSGNIQDINVLVRLDHTYDQDLNIYLVSPQGKGVVLARENGADGDDFGSGADNCGGTFTVFDDEATLSISEGVAPFNGSFRPDNPLSAFDGKQLKGRWHLAVLDLVTDDVGTLFCWKMRVRYT